MMRGKVPQAPLPVLDFLSASLAPTSKSLPLQSVHHCGSRTLRSACGSSTRSPVMLSRLTSCLTSSSPRPLNQILELEPTNVLFGTTIWFRIREPTLSVSTTGGDMPDRKNGRRGDQSSGYRGPGVYVCRRERRPAITSRSTRGTFVVVRTAWFLAPMEMWQSRREVNLRDHPSSAFPAQR